MQHVPIKRLLVALACVAALLVGSSDAIVTNSKQQRSDDQSSSQSQSQSANHNHKAASAGASSSPASQTISVSQSAPISVSGQQQAQPQSYQQQQQQSSLQQYGSSSASAVPKSQSSASAQSGYGLDMSMASSNNDQSYQAAANSVNMALANSGIFGTQNQNGNYASQPAAGAASSQSGASNTANLNPLHYYYYPAKDSSSGNSQASSSSSSSSKPQVELMSSAASQSNNYPSLAAYPSMYADSGSSPEAAASSQDASYLAAAAAAQQPSQSELAAMYGGQQPGSQQQQQQGASSNYAGDLSMFSSNLSPSAAVLPSSQQQQSSQGSVSFPSAQQGAPANNGQQQHQASDYLNSHMQGGHQGVYPFNQMGDLSTSNFGNNAGGMSQASYMSPNAQPAPLGGDQHDHYSSSSSSIGSGQQQQPQFSLSASQLNPSAMAPPMSMSSSNQQQQQQSAGASSLFNTASLFQQQPQQSSGQQAAASANNANNLLAQQYLSSFLNSPYNQLLGQQQSGADTSVSPSIVQPSVAAVAPTSSSSGKRFGISSFIMPMLALAGLSLLIPTMSNIGTAVGRKKRSIGEDRASAASRQQQIAFEPINGPGQLAKELSIGEYMDKIERYYSIYKNAVESEDCMNRLICEFGDAVKDVTGKSAVVTVIEKLVPTWMVGKVHLFKEAALSEKEGKDKCKKYVCSSSSSSSGSMRQH